MSTILIVDDDKNIRTHLAAYIRSCGHEAEVAGSGAPGTNNPARCVKEQRLLRLLLEAQISTELIVNTVECFV